MASLKRLKAEKAGIVKPFAGGAVPDGYLVCDGSSISTTDYAELFNVLSYMYGGAGASFSIPDYRGEFLRGHANGSANDPNRGTRTNRGDGTGGDVNGSKQTFSIEPHTHSIPRSAAASATGNFYTAVGNDTSAYNPIDTTTTGSNETRPRNVNVMYVIKY